MVDIDELKPQIIERLMPLSPDKIILFGSYAYGTPTEESDIDLYVVTSDENIPSSWREKMDIKLKVSHALKDLKEKYDFDLIVHTKAMNQKFYKMGSLFSKEIFKNGNILYG